MSSPLRIAVCQLVTYLSQIDEGDVLRSDPIRLTSPRLYNLSSDIGEANDLASSEPEKFKELKSLWDKWAATMSVRMVEP